MIQAILQNTCKEKSEWVENTPGATTQDFIEQKEQFDEITGPILLKLTEPSKYTMVESSTGFVNFCLP